MLWAVEGRQSLQLCPAKEGLCLTATWTGFAVWADSGAGTESKSDRTALDKPSNSDGQGAQSRGRPPEVVRGLATPSATDWG